MGHVRTASFGRLPAGTTPFETLLTPITEKLPT